MADATQAVRSAPIRMNPLGLGNILEDCFFQYAPQNPFTFTAGNENFQVVIPIQSDAHFVCVSSVYSNTNESGNAVATTSTPYIHITNGGAVIQLTDGGSNRPLSNVQVPVNSLFGFSAELPHIWAMPVLFRANTSIGINITGVAATAVFAAQVIRLTFNGYKIPLNSRPSLGL